MNTMSRRDTLCAAAGLLSVSAAGSVASSRGEAAMRNVNWEEIERRYARTLKMAEA